jgi:hypothetical protein
LCHLWSHYDHPTIIAGAKDDLLCKSDLNLWKQYCPQSEVIYFKDGGHFFNRVHANELVSIIAKKIKEVERLLPNEIFLARTRKNVAQNRSVLPVHEGSEQWI